MKEEMVILVDRQDNQIGSMEKLEAHEKAVLHRAFSVFIFNSQGELLLQQRAHHKYHSPGLWTNTCCSHQRAGESNLEAGKRRLKEEMGMECPLQDVFWFIYKAKFDNGLTEHELDHVLVGNSDLDPVINEDEVADFKWMSLDDLKQDMEAQPELYTEWFKIIFREYNQRLVK
jgi:isopentenyl-diphosphate delta-isomerase